MFTPKTRTQEEQETDRCRLGGIQAILLAIKTKSVDFTVFYQQKESKWHFEFFCQ